MAHTLPLVLMASMLSLAQSFWRLGGPGETCSDACARLGGVCDAAEFSNAKPMSSQAVGDIGASLLDGGCKSLMPLPSFGDMGKYPEVLTGSNVCAFATANPVNGQIADPQCDSATPPVFQRFCFCTATTTTSTTTTTTTTTTRTIVTTTTTTITSTTLAGSQFLRNQGEAEETDNVKDALIAFAITFAAGLCCIIVAFIWYRWAYKQDAKHNGDSEAKSEEGEKDKTSIHAYDLPPGMLLGQEGIGAQNKQEEYVTV